MNQHFVFFLWTFIVFLEALLGVEHLKKLKTQGLAGLSSTIPLWCANMIFAKRLWIFPSHNCEKFFIFSHCIPFTEFRILLS